jgi:dTDP-4-amino-4,6-dideoxygalactose transaminase
MQIPFGNLAQEYQELKSEIDVAINSVLTNGWFILGKQLQEFEAVFAQYCGVKYCVGVASGTEAIYLALKAIGVGYGDEVITVSHTAVPTISAISMTGAIPVFIDILEDTMLMDVSQVESKITPRTKAIIPVHLYGQMVQMKPLLAIAEKHHIPIIEDAAQAHGSGYSGQKSGAYGLMGCFSFYPSKNLGCYGDGGAIVTNDAECYNQILMLRNYGQKERYHHLIQGINSRLDEIQAAILKVKLNYLDIWNKRRQQIAKQYKSFLDKRYINFQVITKDCEPVYHLMVVRVNRDKRDTLQAYLKENQIDTLIHYPIPVHLQKAYSDLGYLTGSLPITERVASEILSLPMYPQLTNEQLAFVAEKINKFFHANPRK